MRIAAPCFVVWLLVTLCMHVPGRIAPSSNRMEDAIRAAILSAPSATALINVTSDAYTAVLDPLEPDLRRGPRHRR